MSTISSQAVLLRKIEFGDYDYIITFLTKDKGKIVAIAKNAKKSIKRFSGKLELFSVLHIVLNYGKRKGLPILQEVNLEYPFELIRTDIVKASYSSYWSEILTNWLEEDKKQKKLYALLFFLLGAINEGEISLGELNIWFLTKFMEISGFLPNLKGCIKCHKTVDQIKQNTVFFDFSKGGLVCKECPDKSPRGVYISKGTIKHLLWVNLTGNKIATRVKFAEYAIREGESFLESFLPYCLGRKTRSLKVLQKIR